MTESISVAGLPDSASGRDLPAWIAGFYQAYLSRDPQRLDAVLDDDVNWLLGGPAEHFDFYGQRRGKGEVIELVTRILPCFIRISDFEIERALAQGERAALYLSIRATQRDTGRAIRIRSAHFLRFRGDKLVSYYGVSDTFDAAEQLVGHSIDVTKKMESTPFMPEDDFSAV